MKQVKKATSFLSIHLAIIVVMLVSSCVGDQSVSKKRSGLIKDFSTGTSKSGCTESLLTFTAPFDTCSATCSSGLHIATVEELSEIKKDLVALGSGNYSGVVASSLLERVNASLNLCVPDVIKDERPTNAIDIKSDFCSCISGKSDLITDCESFCASKTTTTEPMLYVNTLMGTPIALNTKLGNLHNWCSVQLTDDTTKPQCMVSATDGTNTLLLPVTTTAGSNSFSVNVRTLATKRNWILKLVETGTGSNAQSKEFQIRRKDQPTDSSGTVGALKVTPISQYTCMTYGGKVSTTGDIIRTTFARIFYYFAANETPTPIAPAGGSNQATIVCHDEQLNPGNDSALYSRLELIPGAFALWDKADTRFVAKAENSGVLTINKILEQRLSDEYQVSGATIRLFTPINYPNRPQTSTTSSANILLGFMMVPFVDTDGKAYCPTSTHFNGNVPLLNLLGEYMSDTEGIYIAEKEAETVLDGTTYKTIYGTMLVRESTLKAYGFYIENGLKILADASSMNTKTIHYYWPTSTTADPRTAGGRKLFTVRTISTLNGSVISGPSTTEATSDKRLGCVPKSSL